MCLYTKFHDPHLIRLGQCKYRIGKAIGGPEELYFWKFFILYNFLHLQIDKGLLLLDD